jgi:ribosomal protein S18 acetylase RimI-like enzyme
MNIAPCAEADIPAVIALWQACGLTRPWNDPDQDLRFALQGATSTVLVGKQGAEVIASVMVGHDGHRGALYYVAVSPEHRGRGLGRTIHDAAADWLRQRGVWKINLMVRTDNASAAGFYEALGYGANAVVSFGKRLDT